MDNFALMNEAYDEFFVWEAKPVCSPSVPTCICPSLMSIECRTCVAVYQLPLGTDVEIECTAFVNK